MIIIYIRRSPKFSWWSSHLTRHHLQCMQLTYWYMKNNQHPTDIFKRNVLYSDSNCTKTTFSNGFIDDKSPLVQLVALFPTGVKPSSEKIFILLTDVYMHYSNMMTSSNGSIFRFTGHLCGEFTGHRWIPYTKASDAELWYFLWSAQINGWVNNGEAGDLRHHRAHYDITIMIQQFLVKCSAIECMYFEGWNPSA